MSDQYIDIVFDGPPSAQSGRFVEVENEHGHSIKTGEWVKQEPKHPEDQEFWALRIKVKPGLNALAALINQTSTEHGFWPSDRDDALAALTSIDLELNEGGQPNERVALVRRYIEAQEVRNMGEMLMLATSELAEALEEHRSDNPVHYHVLKVTPTTQWTEETAAIYQKMRDNIELNRMVGEGDLHRITEEEHNLLVKEGVAKPEGLAVELADCIIRCLDTMQSLGVDIEEVVREKMTYNSGRPFKHGRAY